MFKGKMFQYKDYRIPVKLVELTGGGTDDWDAISKYHVEMCRKYTPLAPDDYVIEIGCGVGRDAIQLTNILSKDGRYIGIDIIKPSIDWCKKNITPKYKNFIFYYYDIKSQIHNPGGKTTTTKIKLPMKNNSVDKIFLHSVFTHMFEKDIVHYLKEFHRVLKPDGLVLASFFVLDNKALNSVHKSSAGQKHRHPLSFKYKLGTGCFVNDKDYPEGAVGYSPHKIQSMLRKTKFGICGHHVHRGSWSGLKGSNGQDILVLEKISSIESFTQHSRPLQYTTR
jgi:ubiquinone/menaquinone biosynthesis C-methylase UbiE